MSTGTGDLKLIFVVVAPLVDVFTCDDFSLTLLNGNTLGPGAPLIVSLISTTVPNLGSFALKNKSILVKYPILLPLNILGCNKNVCANGSPLLPHRPPLISFLSNDKFIPPPLRHGLASQVSTHGKSFIGLGGVTGSVSAGGTAIVIGSSPTLTSTSTVITSVSVLASGPTTSPTATFVVTSVLLTDTVLNILDDCAELINGALVLVVTSAFSIEKLYALNLADARIIVEEVVRPVAAIVEVPQVTAKALLPFPSVR